MTVLLHPPLVKAALLFLAIGRNCFFLLSLVPVVGFSNAVKNSLQGLIRYKLKLNRVEAPSICQWRICPILGEEGAEPFHRTVDFKTNSSLASMAGSLLAFLQHLDLNPHTAALLILALGCTGQMGFPIFINLSMRVTAQEGISQSGVRLHTKPTCWN